MNVMGIDPGRQALSWSFFVHKELVGAGLVRSKEGLPLGQQALHFSEQLPPGAHICIVERMFQYPSHSRKDSRQRQDALANDLLDLQAIAGIVAGRTGAERIHYLTAHEWKGTVPKEVTKHRVEKALQPWELAVYAESLLKVPGGLRHNVIDAIGLVLRYLRRMA